MIGTFNKAFGATLGVMFGLTVFPYLFMIVGFGIATLVNRT